MTDNITQADANKAAEEGGLPAIGMKMARELLPKLTSLHSRLRNPSSIKINSEADSMAVGDASALCRKLIAADRASRQVANKAEVELILQARSPEGDPWQEVSGEDFFKAHVNGYEVSVCVNAPGKNSIRLEVTPPATTGGANATPTGASTAETIDTPKFRERLEEYDDAASESARRHALNALIVHIDGHKSIGDHAPIPNEKISEALDRARLNTDSHCESLSSEPSKEYSDAYFFRQIQREIGSVGASTVLTDERKPFAYVKFCAAEQLTSEGGIDSREWYEFCEPNEIGDDKLPAFPVYDESVREVAAQAGQVAVPEGFVLMPRRLTAENGAKALLMGEFKESIQVPCPECDGEGDDECLTCENMGEVSQDISISWDNIKAIYEIAVEHLAAPSPAKESK